MIKRFLIFMIAFGGLAVADFNSSAPYTLATEHEVRAFVTVGMDEKAVLDKFGPAHMTDSEEDGLELWQYLVDPHIARVTHTNYYGFEVFIKDKKVTYLGIIGGGH